MRIKLKTILAGPDLRGQPGDVIEVAVERAKALLEAGAAELVERAEAVEAAVVAPVEKAVTGVKKTRAKRTTRQQSDD